MGWDAEHLAEAERAVIRAILSDNHALERLTLQPRDFAHPARALIWTSILELDALERPIDEITIVEQLNGRGRLVGDELALCGHFIDGSNVEAHAEIVLVRSRERSLRGQLSELLSDQRLDFAELQARGARLFEKHAPAEPAKVEKLYGLSMAELMAAEDDEDDISDWRIRGIIPATGPSIVVGEPKAKKTFIIEHLAVSLALGLPCWLDMSELVIRSGRVLVLALEDDFKVTRRRIRRLAWGLGYDPRGMDNLRVEPKTQPFRFDRPTDVEHLRRSLDAWKPDWICVDSLAKTHAVDENSVEKMAPILETWETICRDYSCAVTALHHMNKPNPSNKMARLGNRMRGTSSLFAFARYLVGVERIDRDHSTVDFDGNMLFQPDPFTVSIVDGVNQWGKQTTTLRAEPLGAKKATAELDGLKELLLTALMEGPASASALAKELKKRKDHVLQAFRELMKERKVGNDGYKWRVVK